MPWWWITDCPKGGVGPRNNPWICLCIGTQPFSNTSELLITSYSHKDFMTTSQMVQDLSHWQTDRQTHPHTHYSKQYHLCYTIAAWVVNSHHFSQYSQLKQNCVLNCRGITHRNKETCRRRKLKFSSRHFWDTLNHMTNQQLTNQPTYLLMTYYVVHYNIKTHTHLP